jgi:DNA-binding transcriptional regulator LsrR (DeoR family)
MPRTLLSVEAKQAIATAYKEEKLSQADLASAYSVSRTTIRRALHEHGVVEFNTEASSKERSLLNVIKAYGIETVSRLREVLSKGVQC